MDSIELDLPDLLLLRPKRHIDARGWLSETWSQRDLAALQTDFVQDNHTLSRPGVLRGLHFQVPAQAKLLRVIRGRVFDVVLDLRPASPTFGHWRAFWLTAERGLQVFVPRGFAHGFCVSASDGPAEVLYRLDAPWRPEGGRTVAWNDPDIGIPWPVDQPVLSDADQHAPSLRAVVVAAGWPMPSCTGRVLSTDFGT